MSSMHAKPLLCGRPIAPIGLGCMSLSWAYRTPPSVEDGTALLNRAVDLGYEYLDTARIYGEGRNEELIGAALKGRRKEYFVASKTGIVVDGDKRRIDCRPETIRNAIEESLALLQTDFIDLYYLHRRDFDTPIEESVGALADAVKAGTIGGIGLSEMSAETLRAAAAVHPIAAMQSEYSPWSRNVEIGVLDACRELGTAFVAFSPTGRGALTGAVDPATLPQGDLRRDMPRFVGDNWAKNQVLIAGFAALAQAEGVTPAQLSLGWVLSRGDHVFAIPVTSRIKHLEENIARVDWRPGAETIARIDALPRPNAIQGGRYTAGAQKAIDTEEFG